jgi:hypothetical protein
MELILFLLWMVVVLLSYQLWVLRKAHGLILQLLKELSDRFLGGLGVVDVRALQTIQANFFVWSSRCISGRF